MNIINANALLLEGSIALAQVETNGVRIDVEYLNASIKKTERKIQFMWNDLQEMEEGKLWKRTYGAKFNFNSHDQLGHILFDVLGHKVQYFTATGKAKTDEKALATVDLEFVKLYLKMKKQQKAVGTYLKDILHEEIEGFIHPIFNLHLVKTFRSSSSNPNFQNIPTRDPEVKKLIRTAFIPRPGRRIVEIDFSGLEVAIAACYHKDPTMIEYIKNPKKDMHRDMAMECYKLPLEEMTKEIRYCGKNMFVFPQFYGDWYIDCAKSLWEAVDQMNLKTKSGIKLRDHLTSVGLYELGKLDPNEKPVLGTFEKHISNVETCFWMERFPVYSKWKKERFNQYQKTAKLQMFTGFICQGYLKRNQIINFPVQGAAFHCLLWSLIRLEKWCSKIKNGPLIVGQIHDSVVADVPDNMVDKYLKEAKKITTVELPKEWKWINVPLEIEAEISKVDGSWAEMKGKEI